jgi:RNA polymerase sigma-70 factor, ECF subfamily
MVAGSARRMDMSARPNQHRGPALADEPLHIERAKGGDREAFSQLVRMHQAVVRAYVSTHVRPVEAADDLAQEVFLRAFRRLDAFQLPESGSMRPWLLGIARNLLLEHLRAPARLEARRPADLEEVLETRQMEGGSGPQDAMEMERRIAALQSCVDKLAPSAFALVWRHYFERRTLASLAAEEKKQESALRMRLLRIREVLRACIEQTGEGALP